MNFFYSLFINWKTSSLGSAATIAAASNIYHNWPNVNISDVSLIFAGLMGLFAKDNNVTGGTVSSVTGSTSMRPVSLVDTVPTK